MWLCSLNVTAQNYKIIFGKNYQKASLFVSQNYHSIDSVCRKYQAPANFILALVFPELIRYDALSDQMETKSLEILYVNWGKEYADFSIGRFQMKPSFVERLEQDIHSLKDTSFLKESGLQTLLNLQDEKSVREKRIFRMEQFGWQVNYLIAFYKLCEQKFVHLNFRDDTEKLHFYATAYNSGYWKDTEKLKKMQKSHFYTIAKFTTQKSYNYADIAVFAFKNEKPSIKNH